MIQVCWPVALAHCMQSSRGLVLDGERLECSGVDYEFC
jgi:hypothetical protein